MSPEAVPRRVRAVKALRPGGACSPSGAPATEASPWEYAGFTRPRRRV